MKRENIQFLSENVYLMQETFPKFAYNLHGMQLT